MKTSDIRKYYKPILGGVTLNISATLLYELAKSSLADHHWIWVLLVTTLVVAQVVYTLLVIDYIKQRNLRNFSKRTEALHNFAHKARDLCVKLMPRKPEPCKHRPRMEPVALTGECHYAYRDDVQTMLDQTAAIFRSFTPPGTKVWASIRERRSDDQYHTWVRTTNASASRENSSEPLHKTCSTIEKLRISFKDFNDCVIVTGSGMDGWHKMRSDKLGEDRCVLMGAVMSRSWCGRTLNDPMLNWVLCVCADREGVFSRDHIHLMKSCNDIFSWVLNSFIRHDALLNQRPPRDAVGGLDLAV